MPILLLKKLPWGVFCFCLLASAVQAQVRTVRGTVRSIDDNSPLPGVNVLIKGTIKGTTSDASGAYSLEVGSDADVLVFSFIGYQSEEVTVGQQTTVDIALTQSVDQLAEVLVVGYSEKTKQEITGAVVNVSGEKLKSVTTSSVESLLQGKVAGVQVSTLTGAPGSVPQVLVRGASSIGSSRGALVVVDGIVGGAYNPNDVESVTMLKDAGATALYGSRANSGVLIVTTKKGVSEKPVITYKTTLGTRKITTGNFEMMNTEELYETERAMFPGSAQFLALRPRTLLEQNYDWVDLSYKEAFVQNHNVSARGKSGKIGYYLAGDFYDEEGTLLTTGYKRFNFRSNLDFALSDKVKLTTNLNITRDKTKNYHWRWPYQPFLYLPYDSPYDENGNIRYVDATTPGFLSRDKNNILQSAEYNDYNGKGFTLNGDAVLTVEVTPWLTLQSRNRFAYGSYRSDTYEDVKTIEGAAYDGSLAYDISDSYSLISTNLIRLNHDFGEHHVGGFVGFEGQYSESENAAGNGIGVPSGIKVPSAVGTPQDINGEHAEGRAMSYLGEVNYDYKNKYFVTGSFRRDGASVFAIDKRWGSFGALSASWIISSEDFFRGIREQVTFTKLRGSFGIVGNDNIPANQDVGVYEFSHQYNGGTAGYPVNIPNPVLAWEQTKTYNVGLDVGLFSRVNVAVDAYYKDTDRLLLYVQQPPSQGIERVLRNAGRLATRGIELGIDGDVLRTGDFRWNVAFNIGTAANEVKALADDGVTQIFRNNDGVKQVVQVGKDVNSWYLPKWIGVDPENGDPQWQTTERDADGRIVGYGVTNEYDIASRTENLQIVGSATPKVFGGLSTTLAYKAFTLSVSSSYQYGNDVYHSTREFVDADGAMFNFNMMKLDDGWSRWRNPGDIATHPKPMFGGNHNANKASSRYLEDGGFWRIRNITLNYNVPADLLSKLKLSGANLYVSGDNLFTFTKFSGLDPEVAGYTDEPNGIMAGLSYFKYPISKQYLVGLQISF
ncbi:SusC/RagA family TonB-linked outer membrane protein [Dawidia soli]|uniref:SusC/RagA family TonB-linked outer membrane protein n=1 Tax=Dawidia soli TaxID=2782352 RepID=A0AAP2DCN0_9BACT|nr:SusC/RagA family TonB-linked outer membrane protein [Dawidia soli]MBT1689549.1 SusC/RagA family TonB-linked outer membrane protein [Dawidia soli]